MMALLKPRRNAGASLPSAFWTRRLDSGPGETHAEGS
jgi:hypothetical protein